MKTTQPPIFGITIILLAVAVLTGSASASGSDRPYAVLILADDLGYGDVHCFTAEHCKIAKPGIDRLARQGKWKLLLAKGSGGLTSPREKQVAEGSPVGQLCDMEKDPGETHNLYKLKPQVSKKLLIQLRSDIEARRSVDGAASENDVDNIRLWKKEI